MQKLELSHRTDPSRKATAEHQEVKGQHAYIVRWADETGKACKKTIKKKWEKYALDAALSHLFSEGFVVSGPLDGPLQWLTITREPYPASNPFALDPATGAIWVGDTGFLRRIEPVTCKQTDIDLGSGVTPRALGCDTEGTVYALCVLEKGSAEGQPPWRAPVSGPVSLGMVVLRAGGEPELSFSQPFDVRAAVTDTASISSDGHALAPHPDGAGLYDASGKVERTFPVARTNHTAPKVALSPSGRWAAMTADEGALRLVDLETDDAQIVPCGFAQAHRVRVTDGGVAYVDGLAGSWGLHRVIPGSDPLLLSEKMGAAPTLDESAVVEVDIDRVHLRRIERGEGQRRGERIASSGSLPLGMRKLARVLVTGETSAVVRTDAQTLAGIDLSQLGDPEPDPS